MKILVACEESQAVCTELRALWHEAFSCDILPCSWWHPEWHIEWDVLEQLDKWWDMMIAHPPCTYLSNAWARFLYPKWVLNTERLEKWLVAKDFFMKLYNVAIPKICVENPIPSRVYWLPEYTQIIEPYQFWHPFKKRTCLWLKWLPNLEPTDILDKPESTKVPWNWFNKWWKERQKNRNKTFPWIAKAIATQRTT